MRQARFILHTVLCLLLFSCSQPEKKAQQALVLHDDLGRELVLQKKPERVFAFASSMTEMLYAVLDTSTIIARNPTDDFPEAVYRKPVVSNYPVDYEQVLALKPDLIFTIEGITPLEVAERLEQLGVPVYYQKYRTVEDIFTGLEDIGRIMGREQQAKQLMDSLRQEVAQLMQKHQQEKSPQQVLAITWQDPIYVYGQNTILSDKLRILGAQNAVQEVFDQPYPALTREYILKLNPDVLLGGTREELDKTFFSQYPELRRIKAYQNNRIYKPDDNLMSRPGPRVVESLRELEGFLYP
ncbi:ABC transporter substrate-binding protein [Pontibacter anaerobius]|uniref:ABC transporter substrate-binding protein n=1 Tax=Pontibacter anaerobius TaxID=2993940 RepID=A0ABT3RC14_9BACT|nr:ABC transporter substrate-binding protein [Pontibacter anaerobius]MCX2738963.1 ABC transporter substrate-binding protein [Pontibacter anaerobius]